MEILNTLEVPSVLESKSVGQKAVNIAVAKESGVKVPLAVSLSVELYREFIRASGLAAVIELELGRRDLETMRWEEMWDASLRIRNSFVKTVWPSAMEISLKSELDEIFSDTSVAVRSSAPDEDGKKSSFAGLHASYLNVSGSEEIMLKIKMVWASLWSDAAILYRRDLDLNVEDRAMAVIIQKMVMGESSGVAFRVSPDDSEKSVVESVHGLNEGLVDGSIQPTRWFLDFHTGHILEKHASNDDHCTATDGSSGTRIVSLPQSRRGVSPLTDDQVLEVFNMCVKVSAIYGAPQDMEWTISNGDLYMLQSRNITVIAEQGEDSRAWYLTLRRSCDNLKKLRQRLEQEILPAMDADASVMEKTDLAAMDDEKLEKDLKVRRDLFEEWHRVYYAECIPMAHGMRLFGEYYNDVIMPNDPHEFVELLAADQNLLGMKRNRLLQAFYARLVENVELWVKLEREGVDALPDDERRNLSAFTKEFSPSFSGMSEDEAEQAVLCLILKMPESVKGSIPGQNATSSDEAFLKQVAPNQRDFARDLLDLGRASYRLRDDDNIYIGRIEKCLKAAEHEAEMRGILSIQDEDDEPGGEKTLKPDPAMTPRQLVGQPAGPGIATGKAYVVRERKDIFAIPKGAVMVCDAIDPAMTIAVPFVSAIVERRGGMLIHGAIIAREYGIPCVTGIDSATDLLKNDDNLTVDGYLGIVRITK